MSGSWPSSDFPNLREGDHTKTSDASQEYNCIAWAAEDTSAWWWPSLELGRSYWPEGIPREETVEAFVAAFRTKGYEPCDIGSLEVGFEKIALYVDANNIPTHAARQLKNGHWTSKLGGFEDIEHLTVECLQGDAPYQYGRASLYMKRPISR
jgi:hypothetical protein